MGSDTAPTYTYGKPFLDGEEEVTGPPEIPMPVATTDDSTVAPSRANPARKNDGLSPCVRKSSAERVFFARYAEHLPDKAARMYHALWYYASNDPDPTCYPSRATLAKMVGLKDARNVNRHIQTLVDVGLIRVEHRMNGNGGNTSNLYHMMPIWDADAEVRAEARAAKSVSARPDVEQTASPKERPAPRPPKQAGAPFPAEIELDDSMMAIATDEGLAAGEAAQEFMSYVARHQSEAYAARRAASVEEWRTTKWRDWIHNSFAWKAKAEERARSERERKKSEEWWTEYRAEWIATYGGEEEFERRMEESRRAVDLWASP